MKPNPALETLIEVATRRRDEALRALGEAQREHQQAQVQMAQLQGYSDESRQRWSARASQGVSPTLLHTHLTFMGKLEHAVGFQDGVLQRLAQNIQRCQDKVVLAERELASLNKYQERKHQAWQQWRHTQEQKHNDEMAANLHRHRSAQHPWKQPV